VHRASHLKAANTSVKTKDAKPHNAEGCRERGETFDAHAPTVNEMSGFEPKVIYGDALVQVLNLQKSFLFLVCFLKVMLL